MEQVVRLVRTLKRELGAEPQPATRELALAIRDGRFPEQARSPGATATRSFTAAASDCPGTVTFLVVGMEGMRWRWRPRQDEAMPRRSFAAWSRSTAGQMLDAAGEGSDAVFPLAAAALEAALARTGSARRLQRAGNRMTRSGCASPCTAGTRKRTRTTSALHWPSLTALLAAGHDGQMLLSRATQELVRGALPPGIELQDLGEHRLKGVPHSHRIYQLVGGNLPADFPPLRTPQGRGRALPAAIDGLIGRERELAELTHLLGRKRLVTLTGPGGVGKTSLALAVAGATADCFPMAPRWSSWRRCRLWRSSLPAIAHALGVQETGHVPLLDAIATAIEGERLLLLVDNCEHLAGVADVLANLLARCPQLTVLATSRARLRIKGEQEYPVLAAGGARGMSRALCRRVIRSMSASPPP